MIWYYSYHTVILRDEEYDEGDVPDGDYYDENEGIFNNNYQLQVQLNSCKLGVCSFRS